MHIFSFLFSDIFTKHSIFLCTLGFKAEQNNIKPLILNLIMENIIIFQSVNVKFTITLIYTKAVNVN